MTSFVRRSRSRASFPMGLLAVCVLVVLWCGAAAGHKVNVMAYVEGDQIVVEGYFSAKAKAMNCQVDVLDSQGKKLHEGKTDAQGMYRFPLSALGKFSGDLKFMLHAGMGHQADYVLRASELGSAASAAPKEPDKQPAQDAPASKPESRETEPLKTPAEAQTVSSASGASEISREAKEAPKAPAPQSVHVQETSAALPPPAPVIQPVDIAALTKALEGALDRKIEPVIRLLGQQQKILMEQKDRGPTLSEIVGGIGWILGLVGVTAFFLGRSRSAKGPSD